MPPAVAQSAVLSVMHRAATSGIRFGFWRENRVLLLSLSGVYQPKKELKESKIPVALTIFLKANPQIKTIFLHLDKDRAGRLCTAALKELLQKDYRIVDEPPPIGKDFNDFLMSYLGIARQKPSRERRDAR